MIPIPNKQSCRFVNSREEFELSLYYFPLNSQKYLYGGSYDE